MATGLAKLAVLKEEDWNKRDLKVVREEEAVARKGVKVDCILSCCVMCCVCLLKVGCLKCEKKKERRDEVEKVEVVGRKEKKRTKVLWLFAVLCL